MVADIHWEQLTEKGTGILIGQSHCVIMQVAVSILLIGCRSQLQTEFSDSESTQKEKAAEENNNKKSQQRLLLYKQQRLIVRHWGSFWKSMGDAANTGNISRCSFVGSVPTLALSATKSLSISSSPVLPDLLVFRLFLFQN